MPCRRLGHVQNRLDIQGNPKIDSGWEQQQQQQQNIIEKVINHKRTGMIYRYLENINTTDEINN